jgi:predicted nucleic acid-binding protein
MTDHLDFQIQLEDFRHESTLSAQYVYADMSIQHAASKSKKLLSKLNNNPRFWTTCAASMQAAAYVSIARIFDTKSPYNVNKLLDSMENNLIMFQRDALAVRKQDGKTEKPEWLEEYLLDAYYPTTKDVEKLRKKVAQWRLVYERAIKPVRNKYLAHREKTHYVEVQALFAGGTIRELWRLTTFLLQLNDALWEQLHNGKKPIFRSVRHSVKSIYDAKSQRNAPHESIVADTKKLMQFIENAKLS